MSTELTAPKSVRWIMTPEERALKAPKRRAMYGAIVLALGLIGAAVAFSTYEPESPLAVSKPMRFAELRFQEAPSAARNKGEEGKFGKKDKPKKDLLRSPGSSGTVRTEVIARGHSQVLSHAGGSGTEGDVFAGPGGLGTGINNAMGGLRGTEVGDMGGAGGLGTRGTGQGGGGTAMGIGGLGTYGKGRGTGGYGNIDLESVPAARVPTYNAPTSTEGDRLSTFAIDVDTAAYSIARRALFNNRTPDPGVVRVEEMINYFRYDYEPPRGEGELFSIQADGAVSPVDATKHLLRIGIQAKVIEDPERLPANLVFLVDTSCSMEGPDRLELAKKALSIAVDRLNEHDRVAITTYAGGVDVVLPPTSAAHKTKIKSALNRLNNGGGTAMHSGLELAYRQAAAMLRDNTITRIIVCSDGDANIGATGPEEMLATISGYVKEGVTLSTIGFGEGNYRDEMMETIANKGNGNYYYVDSLRQAQRVFGRDLTKMLQDVAQDVKIQVELDPGVVSAYRLIGYENRDIADKDFRNDRVDAGEIGAGHQVTALYELTLVKDAVGSLGTVRVRAKKPRGQTAKESALELPRALVERSFVSAPEDLRFAVAVVGAAELWRRSPHADAWNYQRVISILEDDPGRDPDRTELLALVRKSANLSGERRSVSMR